MLLQKITIGNKASWFICHGKSSMVSSDKTQKEFLYKEQKFARLYKAGDKILKVCFVQSWPKDAIKKYMSGSQAHREKTSAEILTDLGIKTPRTYFSAFSLSPFNRIESLHEMSFLDKYELLNKHISQRKDSEVIVRLIAGDLAVMTNNMICLKDLGLGNIMYSPEEGLSWIDNDIKRFSDKRQLAAFMIHHLRPRLLNHINEFDAKAFWEVFAKESFIHQDLLQELKK